MMSPQYIAKEMELFTEQAEEVDIIITTANIPGRKAPLLVKDYMIEKMKRGSVIVDLAAENGGNCDGTVANEVVTTPNGVQIIGYTNLAARMGHIASQLYATNLRYLMEEAGWAENFKLDPDSDIIGKMMVCSSGRVQWSAPKPPPTKKEAASEKPTSVKEVKSFPKESKGIHIPDAVLYPLLLLLIAFVGLATPHSYYPLLLLFGIACILGYMLVWNVTSSLHTPLMSITNAISGVVVLSGIVQVGRYPVAAGNSSH